MRTSASSWLTRVHDVEEASPGAVADAMGGDGDGQMRFAGAGSSDQDGVAGRREQAAGVKVAHQRGVDRRHREVEAGEFLGQRQLGRSQAVTDRADLLFRDLGLQQVAENPLDRMLAADGVGHDLVIGGPHSGQMQVRHHRQQLMPFHDKAPSTGCRNGRSRRPVLWSGPGLPAWRPARWPPADAVGPGC